MAIQNMQIILSSSLIGIWQTHIVSGRERACQPRLSGRKLPVAKMRPIYPWGSDWDVQTRRRLNFADRNNPETTSDLSADDGYGDTAPVGSYQAGKSPYGLYDLAGNVWEWVGDWYDPLYYHDLPVNNPAGPTETTQEISLRVLRGGSWVAANQDVFHTSNRNGLEPSKFSSSIGFRCAR